MKKLSTIIIAMALVLGMTQCKKDIQPAGEKMSSGMFIEVYADNVSKVIVTPGTTTAPVTFTVGDTLYVGNNRQLVGKLLYTSGENAHFEGTIDDSKCSTSDYLHFYFIKFIT